MQGGLVHNHRSVTVSSLMYAAHFSSGSAHWAEACFLPVAVCFAMFSTKAASISSAWSLILFEVRLLCLYSWLGECYAVS